VISKHHILSLVLLLVLIGKTLSIDANIFNVITGGASITLVKPFCPKQKAQDHSQKYSEVGSTLLYSHIEVICSAVVLLPEAVNLSSNIQENFPKHAEPDMLFQLIKTKNPSPPPKTGFV
jgi:hypothetical protein